MIAIIFSILKSIQLFSQRCRNSTSTVRPLRIQRGFFHKFWVSFPSLCALLWSILFWMFLNYCSFRCADSDRIPRWSRAAFFYPALWLLLPIRKQCHSCCNAKMKWKCSHLFNLLRLKWLILKKKHHQCQWNLFVFSVIREWLFGTLSPHLKLEYQILFESYEIWSLN